MKTRNITALVLLLAVMLGAPVVKGAEQNGIENRAAAEGNHMAPSDILKKEHAVTMVVVERARREAAAIRRNGKVNREPLAQIVQFFSTFTDDCHHAKEERYYFPAAMIYDTEIMSDLVRELKVEHAYFRGMLEEIDFLLNAREIEPALIAERLDRYAELIAIHIEKENELLYWQEDIYLPEAEEVAMIHGFNHIEQVELGKGFHEKYHDLAQELAVKKQ